MHIHTCRVFDELQTTKIDNINKPHYLGYFTIILFFLTYFVVYSIS